MDLYDRNPETHDDYCRPLDWSARDQALSRDVNRDGVPPEIERLEMFNARIEHEKRLAAIAEAEREERRLNPNKRRKSKSSKTQKKRKKNPQRKIKQYMPKVVKKSKETIPSPSQETSTKKEPKQRKKVEKNHQGFGLDKCKMYGNPAKPYYVPPGYHDFYDEEEHGDLGECFDFCEHCKLMPCLLAAKQEEIKERTAQVESDQRHCDPEWPERSQGEQWRIMNPRLREEVLGNMMRSLFSDRYVKKFGLPACCLRDLNKSCPPSGRKPLTLAEANAIMAEESDSDSDIEFLVTKYNLH